MGGFMLGRTDLQEPGLICWPSAQHPSSPCRGCRGRGCGAGAAGPGLQSSLPSAGFICGLRVTTLIPYDFCEGYRK